MGGNRKLFHTDSDRKERRFGLSYGGEAREKKDQPKREGMFTGSGGRRKREKRAGKTKKVPPALSCTEQNPQSTPKSAAFAHRAPRGTRPSKISG